LISKLLVADPSKRLTAGGALNHPWMKMMKEANEKKNSDNPDFKPTAFNTSTLKRLQSFRGVSKLKKAAMNMLVKMADQS
jgi:serine/threonine protein kinase|tara:strand:+ start:952 stop:1191 length:240 start_codon:yes stop_codon:yes gene_type:complete